MLKIAYKVSQGSPNLPDGFIIDHFQTDKDAVEGYQIATQAVFEKMLEFNINLMRNWEKQKGLVTVDSTNPPQDPRPTVAAQPISAEDRATQLAAAKKALQKPLLEAAGVSEENTKLFQEFLAWKQSQGK